MLNVGFTATSPRLEVDDGQHDEQDAKNELNLRLSLLDDRVSREVGIEGVSASQE